ncbi:hypothetical protein [Paragemmobacter straminiformis]|uniref:Uncharacterized protein n=1 Tax=Paragemmobacter straminiformis TaxID=2045119 RepID=A0A842I403_9RHOB|nr:hypothetical protein [Gemmobacter straminiformis]MBC2834163.1 hypothetical protein [Gemmobacter straminiformis]
MRSGGVLACLVAVLPLGAAAENSAAPGADDAKGTVCLVTDDSGSCSRILACIGTEGRWFNGRAFGRGEGWLSGKTDDGVACSGTWVTRNALGLGQADVTCSDGMTVSVFYSYQDYYTGTAIGRGLSNGGDLVQSWSGEHVVDYFADGRPKAEARMRCGPVDIPVS